MRSKIILTCLVLLTSSVSCTGNMDHDSSKLGQSIQEVRQEVDRHHTALVDLRSMTDVPAEMQRHNINMDGMMDRMHTSMSGMSDCCAGSMDRMQQMMVDIETQLDGHATAVAASNTLDSVRSACATHTEVMNGSLDTMQRTGMQSSCMGGM